MSDVSEGFVSQDQAPAGFAPQTPQSNIPAGFMAQEQAPDAQAAGPLDLVSNFAAPYERMWDQVKDDFSKYSAARHDDMMASASDGVFSWDAVKADFRSGMLTAKTAWDVATSTLSLPFAGIVNAGIVKPGGWLLGHTTFGPNIDREKEVTDAENAVSDALVAAMPSKAMITARGVGVLGKQPSLAEGTAAEAAAAATRSPMVPAAAAQREDITFSFRRENEDAGGYHDLVSPNGETLGRTGGDDPSAGEHYLINRWMDQNPDWARENGFIREERAAGRGGVPYITWTRMGMPPPLENPDIIAAARAGVGNAIDRIDESIKMPRTTGEVIPLDGPSTPAVAEKAGAPTVLDKAGNIRLDLIDSAGADALDVIRQAAKEAGGEEAFAAARKGDIPLQQVDALGKALGMDPGEMDLRGMGRLMRNDQEVRMAIQGMLQSADDVVAAAQKAKRTGALDDLMTVQRLRMRHSVLQEQVAGLTAEWGRTGNVFQEFGEQVKDAQSLGRFLNAKKGESIEDLRKYVDAVADLDPRTQATAFMAKSRRAGFWDKVLYYRANAMLSGVFSHIRYGALMAGFMLYDAGVNTTIAAGISKARELAGSEGEKVFFGEAPARLYGYLMGVPKAFVESYEAVKSGLRVPSGRRIAEGMNPYTQQAPITGAVGTAVGLPSRGINGLHAFVYSLGRRAELEAQSYRSAAQASYSIFSPEFWNHQRGLATYPTEAMMDAAEANGDRLTFTSPLGEKGISFDRFLRKTVVGKFVFPFTKVPWNLGKLAQEGSPLAWMNSDMRAGLMGQNGKIAQDTQIARLIAGSAVASMGVYWALHDRITDGGPTDPKERAEWLLTHKPYSIRIGDEWYDTTKFPGVGPLLAAAATLASVGHHLSEEQYQEGANRLAHATGHFLEDPMGAQGLFDAIKAMEDDRSFATKYAQDFGTSFIPYSTFFGQTASTMDPYMRETQGWFDAFKYKIPLLRETLYPIRDWTGMPIANDHEDWGIILAARKVNRDPVDLEMQRLNIKPARPLSEIGGVTLSPEQYDFFQSRAGVTTRSTLETIVQSPGWLKLPPGERAAVIRSTIDTSRGAARLQTQGQWPKLITDGIKLRMQQITGIPVE